MDGDLLVTPYTECADRVAGFACAKEAWLEGLLVSKQTHGNHWRTVDRRLATQLLKHFGSTSEPVAGFANGDVKDEFLDTKLAHWIRILIFFGIRLDGLALACYFENRIELGKQSRAYHGQLMLTRERVQPLIEVDLEFAVCALAEITT